MGKDTYYDILGVSPTSSTDQIKSNYRSLIQRVHPDLGGPIALFRQVQESYEVLSDPVRRASYDQALAARGRSGSADAADRPNRNATARPTSRHRARGDAARSGKARRRAFRQKPGAGTVESFLHAYPARVAAIAGAILFAVGAALGPDAIGRGVMVLGAVAFLIAIVAWRGARGVKECEAFRRGGMAAIDAMTARQFTALIEHYFASQGYRVARLSSRGDAGDLLLSDPRGRTIVQLRQRSGMVRSDSVQRAVVARAHYGVPRVLLVTSANYSQEAVTAATSNGVTLWNRATLDSELSLFEGDADASGVKRLTSDLSAGTRIYLGAVAALFIGMLALLGKQGRRGATSEAPG